MAHAGVSVPMNVTRLATTATTEAEPGIALAQLGGGECLNVQHFAIDPGASVPAHAHEDREQCTFCYAGEITFVLDDESVVVGPGDVAVLDPAETHAVENRGPETAEGIDVYSPPRPSPDWVSE